MASAAGYDKYIKGQVLGKGSFGSAVLVTHKATGQKYVIKEIDISRMPKQERVAAEQEAKLLMALNHPNIVRCVECFTHVSKLCIVMDWCSEGDLYNICQKRRGAPLTEDTILDWFVQMCLALKHVHDRKILHRDIKTQNIFMSAGGLLKLGDFGVSKILASTWQLAATAVGTPYYLSPEICQNKPYNQKSDIWSLGCVLYELTVGKHAFDGASMRALIQKIIKGQYPPVPSTRSKELRELVDRMLTVSWEKRPSINDILATPVVKARITKFLSATLQAHEFSHTIIHGRPRQGQLVVQHANAAGPPAAGALAPKQPVIAAQQRSPAPAAVQPSKLSPGISAVNQDANRPGSGASAAAAAAARARAVDAAAAAKASAMQVGKEREEAAAAAAAAAARRDDEVKRQREHAAVAARREVERMKLEEQRKKVEAERVRLEGERRKAELARQEAERRAQLSEEAARRAAADEARRRAEAEAKRVKADEQERAKAAERVARERKRDEERAKMAQQRKDYYAQQQQAARNRAAVEQQLQHGAVEILEPPARKPRKQWVIPEPETPSAAGQEGVRADPGPLTPEQRRAIWEEQKAAAERNRRAAVEADEPVGLANFLRVPADDDAQAARVQHQSPQRPGSGAGQAGARCSPDALQQAYERRRQKLEQEAAARQAEIIAYQQAHHREMREAAARNRAAIMAEVDANAPSAVPPETGDQASQDAVAASEMEFAAMIKDMQDILGSDGVDAGDQEAQEVEDELLTNDAQAAALAGRFFLNGEEVALPVREDDSLALKAEAVRCYLETQLGTQAFLTVYKRLESLSLDDDDSEVSKEFLAVLGPDRLPYLQLIHQLIVLEENLNSAA